MGARKSLSGAYFIGLVRSELEKMVDLRREGSVKIPLADAAMSAFALFALKFPSLLKFEEEVRSHGEKTRNLENIFGVTAIPSDTQMREILDEVNPNGLRSSFLRIFEELQRGKILEDFQFFHGHYLMPLDGTGYFYSDQVHCKNCLEKVVGGETSYYHQMLGAALVHPEKNTVIPLCPEAIVRQDGEDKNDCERNAARRFLQKFRKEHPKLKVIVTEDALSSNAPHIRDLESYGMSYILGVKPDGNKQLFHGVKAMEERKLVSYKERQFVIGAKVKKNVSEKYRFVNRVALNAANIDCAVNFLEYWETICWTDTKGKAQRQERHFSWITDIALTEGNVQKIMQGGRARWKIENETFNTLKNQGYEFEHNFGHGCKNLSTVFAYLMMLVFLFDQAQALSCRLFQRALAQNHGRISRLWEDLRGIYKIGYAIPSWEALLEVIANPEKWKLVPNTS